MLEVQEAAPAVAGRKHPIRRAYRPTQLFPWLLMLPAVLLVLLVTFMPVLQAASLAVHETKFLEQGRFIGAANFTTLFGDPLTWKNISNAAVFTFGSLAFSLALALGLALLLNRPFRGRILFRTILILPWVISQVLTALLWRLMDTPLVGPVAYILGELTNSRVDILGDPNTAMAGVMVANIWRSFPYGMILVLAALQTIPSDLYEAANIDGAGRWSSFIHITFPTIRNTFLIVTIMYSVFFFNMAELPLILTGGGPVNVTDLPGLRVFREAFVLYKYGYASAIAMAMFVVNVIVSLAYIKVLRAEAQY